MRISDWMSDVGSSDLCDGDGTTEPAPTSPPPYGWGNLCGQGTWHYEETNGVPGLQAGGFFVAEFPDCDTEIPLPPEAGGPVGTGCIIFNELIEDRKSVV